MQGTVGHSHTQGKEFLSCSQLTSHTAPGLWASNSCATGAWLSHRVGRVGPPGLCGSWTDSSLICDVVWCSDAVLLRNHVLWVLLRVRTAELSPDLDFVFNFAYVWMCYICMYLCSHVCEHMWVYKGTCTHVHACGGLSLPSSVFLFPP